jgi:hypothetical protein
MKLSEFKVGDKVYSGGFTFKWMQILHVTEKGTVIGVCDLGSAVEIRSELNPGYEWRLWQEPKKKVWLWADRNGHVSSHLMDELEAAKEYEAEAKYLPGAEVGFFKLPWSETESP